MTNKVNELNTRFLIPGSELDPSSVADPETMEQDFTDAPFSRLPQTAEMSLPQGWQQLFGLNQSSPEPNRMDPPPRPASLRGGLDGTPESSMQAIRSAFGDGRGAGASSGKVKRMVRLLDSYAKASGRIRG